MVKARAVLPIQVADDHDSRCVGEAIGETLKCPMSYCCRASYASIGDATKRQARSTIYVLRACRV